MTLTPRSLPHVLSSVSELTERDQESLRLAKDAMDVQKSNLENEIGQLKQSLGEAVSQNQDLKQLIESLQLEAAQKCEKLQIALSDGASNEEKLRNDLVALQSRAEDSLRQLYASMQESDKLKRDHQAFAESAETSARALFEKNQRIEADCIKAYEAFNTARNEKDALIDQLDGLRRAVAEREKQIGETLQAKEDGILSAVAEKNRALADVEAKEEQIQQSRANFEIMINHLQEELQSRDKHVAFMSKSLNDMTAQLNGLQKIATETNAFHARSAPLIDAAFAAHSQSARPAVRVQDHAPASQSAINESKTQMPPPPPRDPAKTKVQKKPVLSSLSTTFASSEVDLSAYSHVLSKKRSARAKARPSVQKRSASTPHSSDDEVFGFK